LPATIQDSKVLKSDGWYLDPFVSTLIFSRHARASWHLWDAAHLQVMRYCASWGLFSCSSQVGPVSSSFALGNVPMCLKAFFHRCRSQCAAASSVFGKLGANVFMPIKLVFIFSLSRVIRTHKFWMLVMLLKKPPTQWLACVLVHLATALWQLNNCANGNDLWSNGGPGCNVRRCLRWRTTCAPDDLV